MHQSTDTESQQSIRGRNCRDLNVEIVENRIYGQESFTPEADAADQQIKKQLRSKD
jgi:hypothetical protein